MKKLLLLLLIVPIFGFGQLNSNAKVIKENMPVLYETIKKYSERDFPLRAKPEENLEGQGKS